MIEIIGIIASIMIISSICVSSTSVTGNIIMRCLNMVGSALFIYYGLKVNALSTAIVNAGAICVNICYIIKLIKSKG